MIVGETPMERAKKIAQDTKMEIIEMEIEDWAKECIRLKETLDEIKSELAIADSKRVLWCWAKEEKVKFNTRNSKEVKKQ